MVVLAVEVLGGLAVLLVHLYYPAVNGLELSLFGVEGNVVWWLADSHADSHALNMNQSLNHPEVTNT